MGSHCHLNLESIPLPHQGIGRGLLVDLSWRLLILNLKHASPPLEGLVEKRGSLFQYVFVRGGGGGCNIRSEERPKNKETLTTKETRGNSHN